MKVPHILYHGTTLLRWNIIKENGKMSADISRYFDWKRDAMDYLYFTNSLKSAASSCLSRYVIDMRMGKSPLKRLYESDPMLRNSLIIRVMTSHLRNSFELDPENNTMNHLIIRRTLGQLNEQIRDNKAIWYRHKGDIDIKYLFPYKIFSYSIWGQEIVDIMNLSMDIQEMKDLNMPSDLLASNIRLLEAQMRSWLIKQQRQLERQQWQQEQQEQQQQQQ
jgi:hypothetical protein